MSGCLLSSVGRSTAAFPQTISWGFYCSRPWSGSSCESDKERPRRVLSCSIQPARTHHLGVGRPPISFVQSMQYRWGNRVCVVRSPLPSVPPLLPLCTPFVTPLYPLCSPSVPPLLPLCSPFVTPCCTFTFTQAVWGHRHCLVHLPRIGRLST